MKRLFLVFIALLITVPCYSDSEVTVGGKTASAHIIQEDGTSLRPRPYLNFTGSGATCTDSGGKTVCAITGGGASGAGDTFKTWDLPSGDDIVADSTTDTVTFTDANGLDIEGTAGTDTIAFTLSLSGHATVDTVGSVGLQPDAVTEDTIVFGSGTGQVGLDDVCEGDCTTDVAMEITATNATTTPLTITGVASQSVGLFEIEDDSANKLFKVWQSGHLETIEGFRTTTPNDGPGIWIHLYGESAPEHSNQSGWYDHTGGTYEKLFTKTAGDDFAQADEDNGNWILMTSNGNLGKVFEIKEYISTTQVIVSGMGVGGDVASGGAAETFVIYKHPSFVSGDGAKHEFSVEETGEFEVFSYDFTGSKMIEFKNRVASDNADTLHIEHEANGYNNSDMMQLFYTTGEIQTDDTVQGIQMSVDETSAVGGEMDLIYLETTDATALEKHAIHVSVGLIVHFMFQVQLLTTWIMDMSIRQEVLQ